MDERSRRVRMCEQGGKAAAQTILDMRRTGDFSKQSCKQYERRCGGAARRDSLVLLHASTRANHGSGALALAWSGVWAPTKQRAASPTASLAHMATNARRWYKLFGHDFVLSQKMAEAVWRYPILLDAMASEMQRKGDAMMSKWAEIMTNMQVRRGVVRWRGRSRPLVSSGRGRCAGAMGAVLGGLVAWAQVTSSTHTHPVVRRALGRPCGAAAQPKTYFFRPDIAAQLGIAVVREVLEQYVFGKPDRYKLKA